MSFARDEALQGRVSEHIRALEAEVEVLRGLKHENIVRYLGTERTADSMYIFLEYVHGGSIASLLAKFGAFQEAVIRVYTRQILRGLEYLHERGIMHRDIKVWGAWGRMGRRVGARGGELSGCCHPLFSRRTAPPLHDRMPPHATLTLAPAPAPVLRPLCSTSCPGRQHPGGQGFDGEAGGLWRVQED